MRKLKHHEKKLLKKVNGAWSSTDDTVRENTILRRYAIHKREDYMKYNRLAGMITSLANKLKDLPEDDEIRAEYTDKLLDKLHNMGLIPTKSSLSQAAKVQASFSFLRLMIFSLSLILFAKVPPSFSNLGIHHLR